MSGRDTGVSHVMRPEYTSILCWTQKDEVSFKCIYSIGNEKLNTCIIGWNSSVWYSSRISLKRRAFMRDDVSHPSMVGCSIIVVGDVPSNITGFTIRLGDFKGSGEDNKIQCKSGRPTWDDVTQIDPSTSIRFCIEFHTTSFWRIHSRCSETESMYTNPTNIAMAITHRMSIRKQRSAFWRDDRYKTSRAAWVRVLGLKPSSMLSGEAISHEKKNMDGNRTRKEKYVQNALKDVFKSEWTITDANDGRRCRTSVMAWNSHCTLLCYEAFWHASILQVRCRSCVFVID